MIDNFDFKQIVKPLQVWFDGHARVLPWRENPTAYYVWISEIMLQQTRVEAVKPYFHHRVAGCKISGRMSGEPVSEIVGRARLL